ncbi:MAG: hypothetical protein AAF138_06640 [Planctomycetota bacterium]
MTQTVRPAQDRDLVVDALRGLAVMGILAVNIVVFAWPSKVGMDPRLIAESGLEYAGAERWVFQGMQTLFTWKMQFLFGLLFGAGAIYYGRKFEGGRLSNGAGLWYRRMAVLLGLGLVHAFGLWYGDILVTYAAVGLVALWWLRRLPIGAQVGIGFVLLAWGWALSFVVLGFFGMESPEGQFDPTAFGYEMSKYGAGAGYLDALVQRLWMLGFMYVFMLPFWWVPYFLDL